MRLAWFRATPPDSNTLLDRTAPLIDALRRLHTLDIITAAEAHDFVWKHGRQPYELCVYEIGSSPAQRFVHAVPPALSRRRGPHRGDDARPPVCGVRSRMRRRWQTP